MLLTVCHLLCCYMVFGVSKKCLIMCQDCRSGTHATGYTGDPSHVQENRIYCIIMVVTITVVLREYNIRILGALGFGKLFLEEID